MPSDVPVTLEAVQAQLSRGHGIEIRALPAGTKPSVDRSAAVATALFLVDRTTGDYLMAATGAI